MVSDTSLLGLRQLLARGVRPGRCDEAGVRRLWWGALEVIQQALLERQVHSGLWMAAPLPALYEPELLLQLQGWVWPRKALSIWVHAMRRCPAVVLLEKKRLASADWPWVLRTETTLSCWCSHPNCSWPLPSTAPQMNGSC